MEPPISISRAAVLRAIRTFLQAFLVTIAATIGQATFDPLDVEAWKVLIVGAGLDAARALVAYVHNRFLDPSGIPSLRVNKPPNA